jgi:hypothetical protein
MGNKEWVWWGLAGLAVYIAYENGWFGTAAPATTAAAPTVVVASAPSQSPTQAAPVVVTPAQPVAPVYNPPATPPSVYYGQGGRWNGRPVGIVTPVTDLNMSATATATS